MSTLPGDVAKSTFERLAEITSQNGDGMSKLVVKRPNQKYRNEYIPYAKTKDENEAGGTEIKTRKSQL